MEKISATVTTNLRLTVVCASLMKDLIVTYFIGVFMEEEDVDIAITQSSFFLSPE